MADEKNVDWEAIEFDYRAGVLSLREIAALHPGTNHVAITRRAKKEGWTRNLAAKIKAKADDLVTRRVVTPDVTAQRVATEREVIEANAERIAQVRGEHRGDIARLRTLALKLMAELEGQTENQDLLAQLGDLMAKPDDKGVDKMRDLFQKVISTPSRVDSVKKIAETLKAAIGLEREAYGLDSAAPTGGSGNINISF